MIRGEPYEGISVVVVGDSAGGLDALKRLVVQLPQTLRAAVFIVQHLSADATADVVVRSLNMVGKIKCTEARDGELLKLSHIYMAPADQHLLLGKRKLMVTKGARENRSRPGIDPLFRSAAVAHGNRVIGFRRERARGIPSKRFTLAEATWYVPGAAGQRPPPAATRLDYC